MSKKRKKFSSEFKAKVVLEVLEGNATINEIVSKYGCQGQAFCNIYIERFFRNLKQENVYPSRHETLKEAKIGIRNYIDTYNFDRPHSSIGYRKPMEVYRKELNMEVT